MGKGEEDCCINTILVEEDAVSRTPFKSIKPNSIEALTILATSYLASMTVNLVWYGCRVHQKQSSLFIFSFWIEWKLVVSTGVGQ